MTVFFYNIFLFTYRIAIRITALWNNKARLWLAGRKNIFDKIIAEIGACNADIVWMHCSSLGEFEQGRPLLEKLRLQYPASKFLLTFFSPSGYEVQKDYSGADWVFYLPMDSPVNARRFLDIVNPSLVIFVKYEFWYYYIKAIKENGIPLLLISALFPENTAFFKWYGRLQRKMLPCFNHFFVQDEESKKMLGQISYTNVTVAGDTRFDRVIEIAKQFTPIPAVEQFAGNSKVIVAGSTWKEDEIVLQKALALVNQDSLKLIIAPHELAEKDLSDLEKLFPNSIRFSQISTSANFQHRTCLIIDNMGMLSKLYKYGHIAYVGGGMTSYGVHNVLEAAVYSKPVIIGPHYKKYIEAVGLVDCSGAIVSKNENELTGIIEALLKNKDELYKKSCDASGRYVMQYAGATKKILQYIQENRLLTN